MPCPPPVSSRRRRATRTTRTRSRCTFPPPLLSRRHPSSPPATLARHPRPSPSPPPVLAARHPRPSPSPRTVTASRSRPGTLAISRPRRLAPSPPRARRLRLGHPAPLLAIPARWHIHVTAAGSSYHSFMPTFHPRYLVLIVMTRCKLSLPSRTRHSTTQSRRP